MLDENLWFANASSSFPSAINYTRAAMGPLIYEMVSNIDAYAQLGASLPRHVRDHPRVRLLLMLVVVVAVVAGFVAVVAVVAVVVVVGAGLMRLHAIQEWDCRGKLIDCTWTRAASSSSRRHHRAPTRSASCFTRLTTRR